MNIKETKKEFSFMGDHALVADRAILEQHIVPNFAKDNEVLISQLEFMDLYKSQLVDVMGANITSEEIRISHARVGRVPSALHKKPIDLLPEEITTYYERLAFVYHLEKPKALDGERDLHFVAGGIKAYNLDNLGGKSNSPQHFKAFIGLQNGLCMNLCIFGQGFQENLQVLTKNELKTQLQTLIMKYSLESDYEAIQRMKDLELEFSEIRNLIGNARLINAMPAKMRVEKKIPEMPLTDTQFGAVAKGFYTDSLFRGDLQEGGKISLWNFYNLMTSSNKTSYIDEVMDRNVACSTLAVKIAHKDPFIEKLMKGDMSILN